MTSNHGNNNASRTEKERFRQLRRGIVKKAHTFAHADVYVIIRKDETCYTYNSTNVPEIPSTEEFRRLRTVRLKAPVHTKTNPSSNARHDHQSPDSPDQTKQSEGDDYEHGVWQGTLPSEHADSTLELLINHTTSDRPEQITHIEDNTPRYLDNWQDMMPWLHQEELDRMAMVLSTRQPFSVCMPPMLHRSPTLETGFETL